MDEFNNLHDSRKETRMTQPPFLATERDEGSRGPKPTSGTVHPGVKVLTRAAQAVPGAEDMYEAGVLKGVGYGAIDKHVLAMAQRHDKSTWGKKRSVLTPRNVNYFRVFSGDFTNPDNAEKIMELYGEDRGEGRKLYTFPVMFMNEDPQEVHTQEFVMWRGSKRARWSEPDGVVVKGNPINRCMSLEQIDPSKDPRPANKRRRFGGRKSISNGICDPNECEDYGSGACNLNAALYFHIPGIESLDPVRLPFTSIYAASEMGEKLWSIVHEHPLGRINGSFQGDPIFWLAKEERTISKLDPDSGEAKPVTQQIIVLDARIDMAQVAIAAEQRLAGGAPIAAIEAGTEDPIDAEVVDDEAPDPEPVNEEPEEPQGPPTKDEAFAKINEYLETLGVVGGDFREWAGAKWGEKWSLDEQRRGWALDALSAAVEDGTPESVIIPKSESDDGLF